MIIIEIILVFTLTASVIEVWALINRNKTWGKESIRIVGLTIIIGAILIISTIVDEQHQNTILALLGTVAGCLLGKEGTKDDKENQKTKDK